jgi:hypothetical protein
MSTSPPVPIPVTITPLAIPAVAIPVTVPVAIPFAVPVLSAIERQDQRECIGWTSLLEKQLIIIQQLIVINKGQLCSFDEAAVQVDATGMDCHRTAECMASLTEAKFLRYLGRPPSIPGNEKSGGIHLDNPHFTTWLHLSMLIDIQTPLINQDCKPRGAIYQLTPHSPSSWVWSLSCMCRPWKETIAAWASGQQWVGVQSKIKEIVLQVNWGNNWRQRYFIYDAQLCPQIDWQSHCIFKCQSSLYFFPDCVVAWT